MNPKQTAALRDWLMEQIADCETRRTALWADDRKDEANFARIRSNVYDIFRTVLKVAESRSDGEVLFAAKLTEIPAAWQKAHDQAEHHGAAAALCIERIKLDAAAEIREKFETIRREIL